MGETLPILIPFYIYVGICQLFVLYTSGMITKVLLKNDVSIFA